MGKIWQIKEVRVALLVIGALVLVFTGLGYLKNRSLLSQPAVFSAVYDRGNGLNVGDPVLLNDFGVGIVRETRIDPVTYHITAFFEVDRAVKLPEGTVAMISSLSLLGDKGIRLLPGTGPGFLKGGTVLPDSLEEGVTDRLETELIPLKNNLNETIQYLSGVSRSLNAILRDTLKYQRISTDLATTLHNFADASGSFKTLAVKLDTTAAKLESLMANLEQQNARIDRMMAGAATVSDSLAAASGDLKAGIAQLRGGLAELNTLLTAVNDGQGSLGKLATDDSLYTHLSHTAASLDKLFIDLREHPKRYVHFSLFGRRDKADKAAEKAAKRADTSN